MDRSAIRTSIVRVSIRRPMIPTGTCNIEDGLPVRARQQTYRVKSRTTYAVSCRLSALPWSQLTLMAIWHWPCPALPCPVLCSPVLLWRRGIATQVSCPSGKSNPEREGGGWTVANWLVTTHSIESESAPTAKLIAASSFRARLPGCQASFFSSPAWCQVCGARQAQVFPSCQIGARDAGWATTAQLPQALV
ncbi:uncharacterized protein BCR38DRAFT_39430 [Pseudomassariella vexata]|uniref:Uncharacterized protein n=1 Tax=Pseudomassariella vexata TaxID=1141098 RepID=A0A1Y2DR88_9PEZI|nr:uncharacterized protein BCR38DRAFT_39430 [Pseudomassariella vexata]ORY61781.1 hypothetical protein BCR38DRAFT_39430 [Pseudomassariella vexata]